MSGLGWSLWHGRNTSNTTRQTNLTSPTVPPSTDHPVDSEKGREIRLCSCGKPAEHDSICNRDRSGRDGDEQVERVDHDWEEIEARRREDRHQKRQRSFDADRREQRAGMNTLDLHRHAIQRQAKISTVAAGNIEPSPRGSEPAAVGPPRQQLLDDDPRWREHSTVIRTRLELMHELLDEAEGLSTVASTANMLGVEKDRMILAASNRGLRAQAVVDRLGSHIAGSAETVRRVRRAAGQDHLGNDLPIT